MERIEAAAIRWPKALGVTVYIPRPGRHSDIIRELKELNVSLADVEQGFLTSTGRFVDRLEAFKIAGAAGQLRPGWETLSGQWLYSEDVW